MFDAKVYAFCGLIRDSISYVFTFNISQENINPSSNSFQSTVIAGCEAYAKRVTSNYMNVNVKQAAVQTGLLAGIIYSPHIVNFFYAVPSAICSFGPLAFVFQTTDTGVFSYQAALNLFNGNGVTFFLHVFGPLTAYGAFGVIQLFSNYVDSNPSTYNNYTLNWNFQPVLVFAAIFAIKVSLPLLFGPG